MGKSLEQANDIYTLCRKKDHTVAVNLQGRYAPAMLLVKRAIDEGLMGDIHDITCTENTLTPWNLWALAEKRRKDGSKLSSRVFPNILDHVSFHPCNRSIQTFYGQRSNICLLQSSPLSRI